MAHFDPYIDDVKKFSDICHVDMAEWLQKSQFGFFVVNIQRQKSIESF